jgi:glycosyltransferase involved in cell wall biosynthesis
MSRYLLIGPCQNRNDSSQTGGVIVLFEDLLFQFKKRNIENIVIDTNKSNYSNILFAMLIIYLKIFFYLWGVNHISLHGTANDYVYIAPFMIILCKLFRKKCSTRKFAGNFNTYYNNSSKIKKRIIKFVLENSTYNFFETKYLVAFFEKFNKNTFWFPNVRNKPNIQRQSKFQKRLVFISQLYKSKGVDEILEASNLLDDDYIIDLYGPLRDDYKLEYFDKFKANYKGSLKPDEVLNTMNQYDVVILASYYPGEGYPGVIIEALSLGKPVIVTDLDSIKEMVDESCAIFVKAKSSEDIQNAMMSFNSENYSTYSYNAIKAFEKFNSDIQTDKFLERIND